MGEGGKACVLLFVFTSQAGAWLSSAALDPTKPGRKR